jgi:hypothetical protein
VRGSGSISDYARVFNQTWLTVLRKAGLCVFPIYSLRATLASRLSAARVPDGFVSQMLGPAGGYRPTQPNLGRPTSHHRHYVKAENVRPISKVPIQASAHHNSPWWATYRKNIIRLAPSRMLPGCNPCESPAESCVDEQQLVSTLDDDKARVGRNRVGRRRQR